MKYKNQWVKFFVKKCDMEVELNPISGMIRYLKKDKWFYPNPMKHNDGYFSLTINKKRVKLHDIFCRCFHGDPPGDDYKADHINGKREDNRPWNLRWADPRMNALNRKPSKQVTSKYRGVCYRYERENWKGTVHDAKEVLGRGKRVHCGSFKTDIEAAKAVDEMMIELGYEEEFLNKNMFDLKAEEALSKPKKMLKKEKIDKKGVWKKLVLPKRVIYVSSKGVVKYTHKRTGETIYTLGSKKQEEGKYSYRSVKFNERHYRVHRLVMAAFDDLDLDDLSIFVDHIDNNPLNNNLKNLRKATAKENNKNRKSREKNVKLQELAAIYLKEYEKTEVRRKISK